MSNQQGQQPTAPGTISPDGLYVWDGFKWWEATSVPLGTSLDGGQTVWDGHGWAPRQGYQQQPVPPQNYQPQPATYEVPQATQAPPRKGMGTWAIVGIVAACIVGGLVLIGILGSAGGSSDNSSTSAGGSTSAKATPSQSNGISKGFGSQDASGDIALGSITKDPVGGSTIQVKATNHSEKRSDYSIDLAVESADGKTQYETTSAFIYNVEPGQTGIGEAIVSGSVPSGAKAVVKEVSRTSAVG